MRGELMVTAQEPTSEAQPQEAVQPPAEEPTGKPEGVTAEGAEAPAAEVQEKDALADVGDDQLLEHPRLKTLLEKRDKEATTAAQDKLDKAIGKEKRRIAREERDHAQAAYGQRKAQMREQIMTEMATEDDPDKRRELHGRLGMQDAIDNARGEGLQGALDQWHAEGRLFLEEAELLPADPREKAELQIRVQEKHGQDATFFQQVNELIAYKLENYVPKADVEKLAQEKAKAITESAAGEEARNTETPVELPPTGGTVADYTTACRLFNAGELSLERFKEFRRQFGVS